MYFIFGYLREVPVKFEKKTSIASLIAIAVLVVLLFIFLSFEDVDEPTRSSYLTFNASSCSSQMDVNGELGIESETDIEQNFWRSELKNSPR